jgi:hypothetical protein
MSFLQDLAGQTVQSITVDSSLFPQPVVLDRPLEGGGSQVAPGVLLRLVRPQVTVQLAGGDPITYAPGGPPSTAVRVVVWVAAAALLLLAIHGAYRLVKR